MEKYNWKEDSELLIMLSDTARTPVVKTKPIKQFKITALPVKGRLIVHNFVPEWAVGFLERNYNDRSDIKAVSVIQTFPVTKER